LNSVSEVECFQNRILVQVTSRLEIEYIIIVENTPRFILTYTSLLSQSPLIDQYNLIAQNPAIAKVISGNIQFDATNDLTTLLSLFKKDNTVSISS